MTDLAKIFNPNPVVIPQSNAKTYPDSYIVMLHVDTVQDKQQLNVIFRPYNYENKEIYPGYDKDAHMSIPDIYAEAANHSLFAQTLGMIVYASDLLFRKRVLIQQITSATEDTSALESELAQVIAQLNTI